LSEAASVQIATPIYIEPNELRTTGKGLGEYDISINMPEPWEGGWWRLSDILSYEMENNLANLHTSAPFIKMKFFSSETMLPGVKSNAGRKKRHFITFCPKNSTI
jgi:hypothetical protein